MWNECNENDADFLYFDEMLEIYQHVSIDFNDLLLELYRVSTKSGYFKISLFYSFIYVIFLPRSNGGSVLRRNTFLGYVERESLLSENYRFEPHQGTHYQSVC